MFCCSFVLIDVHEVTVRSYPSAILPILVVNENEGHQIVSPAAVAEASPIRCSLLSLVRGLIREHMMSLG